MAVLSCVKKMTKPPEPRLFIFRSWQITHFENLIKYAPILSRLSDYELFPDQYHKRTIFEIPYLETVIERIEERFPIDSTSTLATVADNPGPGRILDKCFYQPMGKAIERVLFKLELRYFRPPQKLAQLIYRFLENCHDAGQIRQHNRFPIFPVQAALRRQKGSAGRGGDLLVHMCRSEGILRAFQLLLIQASVKSRSMRAEAQKQLFRLCRFENMPYVLNGFELLEPLLRDGDYIFMNCSPNDPDLITQFSLRSSLWSDLDMELKDVDVERNEALRLCLRENRGFHSFPIGLIYTHLVISLNKEVSTPKKTCIETIQNIYLDLVAIHGFTTAFPDQMFHLKFHLSEILDAKERNFMKDSIRTSYRLEDDEYEMIVHVLMSLLSHIKDSSLIENLERRIQYFMSRLNRSGINLSDENVLFARASEQYLRRVNDSLIFHNGITFETFKNIFNNPLTWEKYHRPSAQDLYSCVLRRGWHYQLCISKYLPSSPDTYFDYIPFNHETDLYKLITRENYQERFTRVDLHDIFPNVSEMLSNFQYIDHASKARYWCLIENWQRQLRDDNIALDANRPGTKLHVVMNWWREHERLQTYKYDNKSSDIGQTQGSPVSVIADDTIAEGVSQSSARDADLSSLSSDDDFYSTKSDAELSILSVDD